MSGRKDVYDLKIIARGGHSSNTYRADVEIRGYSFEDEKHEDRGTPRLGDRLKIKFSPINCGEIVLVRKKDPENDGRGRVDAIFRGSSFEEEPLDSRNEDGRAQVEMLYHFLINNGGKGEFYMENTEDGSKGLIIHTTKGRRVTYEPTRRSKRPLKIREGDGSGSENALEKKAKKCGIPFIGLTGLFGGAIGVR